MPSDTPLLWVFGLCAQWCGTCREYQPLFDRLAKEMPQARFVWVDVEEHDALLGDLDIENFPTLLLANAQMQACFAGTVLPHADTLKRMWRIWSRRWWTCGRRLVFPSSSRR